MATKKKKSFGSRLLLLLLVKLPAAFILLTVLWVLALKWIPPVATPLMV